MISKKKTNALFGWLAGWLADFAWEKNTVGWMAGWFRVREKYCCGWLNPAESASRTRRQPSRPRPKQPVTFPPPPPPNFQRTTSDRDCSAHQAWPTLHAPPITCPLLSLLAFALSIEWWLFIKIIYRLHNTFDFRTDYTIVFYAMRRIKLDPTCI